MKKILSIIFTITLAYITAYYTTDTNKKQNTGNFIYKLKCWITDQTDTTDAWAVKHLAEEYQFDYEQYNNAIKYYRKTLELNPDIKQVNYSIAQCYLFMGDTLIAMNMLDSLLIVNNEDEEALSMYGKIYYKQGNLKKAEEYFLKSNKVFETSDNFYALSKINYKLKKYNQALFYINKAIVNNEYYMDLFNFKRKIFIKLNQPDSASAIYSYILSNDSEYFPDYATDANTAKEAGNYKKAIILYTKAIEVDPGNIDLITNRGWAYVELELYDSAYYDFSLLTKLDSNNYYHYFNKAYVLDYMDSVKEAIRDYNTCLIYYPDYYITYNNMGYEYYRLEDFTNAEKYYSKSIALKDNYYLSHLNRAILYYEAKKYKKTIADCKKTLEISSNNTSAIYYLALSYDKLNKQEKALDYYNEYIRLRQDDIDSTTYEEIIKRIAELSSL